MTTDEFHRNRDNFCYRHPDRQSFVLCQRCLRTICPECQTQAAVGVICPECLAEQRAAATPAQRKAERRWSRPAAMTAVSGRPTVTYAIIAVTALVFVVTLIPGIGRVIEGYLSFYAPAIYPQVSGVFQPWRVLTVALVHSGFWHVGLNMLALWFIGRSLEPLLGAARFLLLYVLSAAGGSVAVALLAPNVPVVGASGAIFGLFGALLVIGRHLGANIRVIAILIGVNFALPFVLALLSAAGTGSFAGALSAIQISWQSHLGGLIVGAAVGLIYARTRAARQARLRVGLLIALTGVLVGLLALPPVLYT
ncbi:MULTISPECIES: rhomboid family intramembrane serine protease [Microbacterium]|uniref:Rhomboid family intramembrane serine protease n=1 Tax=Microbacterium wangchenii TaxID=2541726 RepID=A0ABX5SM85_9MICO|nr:MULTISPECIES: rhomboid family intramembrane serine protease [Microbacterium]MCK6066255.1 rhomboid family intramembrane serine protease [Microbacterium sp. EYE_512]QBR87233.1 rhomboid family intramembrane serine protease [Microbacterium wangchenii]TXK14552.1 rhomboid family intramembrane serine protease [Microbacterium wangchenii]